MSPAWGFFRVCSKNALAQSVKIARGQVPPGSQRSVRLFHQHPLRQRDFHPHGSCRQPLRHLCFHALEEIGASRIAGASVQFRREGRKYGSPRERGPLRAERAGLLSAFEVLPNSVFAAENLEGFHRSAGKATVRPERRRELCACAPHRMRRTSSAWIRPWSISSSSDADMASSTDWYPKSPESSRAIVRMTSRAPVRIARARWVRNVRPSSSACRVEAAGAAWSRLKATCPWSGMMAGTRLSHCTAQALHPGVTSCK